MPIKEANFMKAPENTRGTDGLKDTKEYSKGKNKTIKPVRTGNKSLKAVKPRA